MEERKRIKMKFRVVGWLVPLSDDTILKNKITAQTKLITDNNNKIKGLEKTVNNYQKKCYQCIHNISKQESDKSNS